MVTMDFLQAVRSGRPMRAGHWASHIWYKFMVENGQLIWMFEDGRKCLEKFKFSDLFETYVLKPRQTVTKTVEAWAIIGDRGFRKVGWEPPTELKVGDTVVHLTGEYQEEVE